MTIAVGIRCSDGLLIGTDSEITEGELSKYRAEKIMIFHDESQSAVLAAAYAGSVPFARMYIERLGKQFLALKTKTVDGIRAHVEESLIKFHKSYIYKHPRHGYQDGPDFSLIIGVRGDDLSCELLCTADAAVNSVEVFQPIGIGEYLARYLLHNHSFLVIELERAQPMLAAALTETKKWVRGCGGGNRIVRISPKMYGLSLGY